MLKRILRHLWRLRPARSLRSLTSQEAYQQWAASYPPHAHNRLMQLEQEAMMNAMPSLTGCTVLDLACGTGRYSLLAQQQGARQVIGLDNSFAMLRSNPTTINALSSLEALSLADGSIDVVICALALGHVPDLVPAVAEIHRVLKPEGVVMVSDFHPFQHLQGNQRTFTSDGGKIYAVEHYAHLYADYHQAASLAGLRIDHILEPGLKNSKSSTSNSLPIIIVYRLLRQS